MINRRFFFDHVRETLFRGHLSLSQVEGMEDLLDRWEEDYAALDDRWLAYMLGTAFHEVAGTMQPIEEFGRGAGRPYGRRDPQTGQRYYGRGFVQLTWRENYARMGRRLGIDLVRRPALALRVDVAAEIMFIGMIEGLFTGRRLAAYFNEVDEDSIQARQIVNRLDRATLIAGYARQFYAALSYTTA